MLRINSLSSHGVVLPVVLWLLMFFLTLIVSFTASTNLGIRTVSNIKENFYAHQAMEGSVYEFLYSLSSKPDMRRYGIYESRSSNLSGQHVNVEIVPEYMKMNINSFSEVEIERLIRLYLYKKTGSYISTLQRMKSSATYLTEQNVSVDRRYVSIHDINRRGYRTGLNESLSRYFTIFSGRQRNVYSIYPTLSPGGVVNDGNGVVYAVVTGAENQPYMIVDWLME